MKNLALVCFTIISSLSCTAMPCLMPILKESEDYRFITEIIDSKALSGYWHIEHFPERSPLVIEVPAKLGLHESNLIKFGAPVQFVDELQTSETVFHIKEIIEGDSTKTITFAYPPEGLRGSATFSEKSGEWYLQNIELIEL